MRLLVYNIAYGTGAPKRNGYERLLTAHRYIKTDDNHLDKIIHFIDDSDADLVGLIEVDTGSYRTNQVNQVEKIAGHLEHYHHSSIKYHDESFARMVPILRHQANAVLAKDGFKNVHFHFMPVGVKRLIIEADCEYFDLILVHLALQAKTRAAQLGHIRKMIDGRSRLIVAGDFNTLRGAVELEEFKSALGLLDANSGRLPTYPSWKPTRQLDFILHTPDIIVQNFRIPQVPHSDHLPLIMDFD